MFRQDFAWGVASSAYQIEGRDKEDGCGKNIWDTFTEEGRVYENQNAYVSCDEIHRYKEDFALMRLLGIRAYRFSLSWPESCRREPARSMKRRSRSTAI